MKRWWPTYILVLGGLLVLVALAYGVRLFVLHEEEFESAEAPLAAVVVLTLYALPGAHCVAMFATRPAWRRRALYVVRRPWTAIEGVLLFLALLLGPEIIFIGFVGLGQALTGQQPAAPAEAVSVPDEAVAAAAKPPQEEDGALEGYGMMARAVVAAVILLLIVRFMPSPGRNVWRRFGFGQGRLWRQIGIGVVAYLVFTWTILPVLGTGIEMLFNLFGQKAEPHEAVRQYQQTHSAVLRAGLLVSMLLTAPFFEEIIFRGVLLQTIKRYVGSAAAIGISALIFAALHGSLYVAANIFFLGLLFGYVFDKTGSIVPGMVLHFLFNGTSAVALVLGS
jgi:membrane protease YdiL (CAAX protease family)